MNYEQALEYIHGIYRRGKKDGLKRITELLELLGNPQNELKFIHVAGTNGKGSVCAMLSKILEKSGVRAGLFTSPYIVQFNERIQLCGEQISDKALAEVTQYVSTIAETMKILPSEFELVTAIALEYFKREGCEIVVFETGLGGRFDATNVVSTKIIEIITPIDYDHMRELGTTIEEITEHKCGIILPNTTVITCEQASVVLDIIKRECKQKQATLSVAKESDITLLSADLDGQSFAYCGAKYRLALLGEHQLKNVGIVMLAVKELVSKGFAICDSSVKSALEVVRWVGRFEAVFQNPPFIIDGGHNPQGVAAAVSSAKKYLGGKKLTVLLGVMADKDFCEMFSLVNTVADRYIATNPIYPRALSADKLGKQLEKFGKQVVVEPVINLAVKAAIEAAKSDEDGAVLCVGTLYMVGDLRCAARTYQKNELRKISKNFFVNRVMERKEISKQIADNLFSTEQYKKSKIIFGFMGTETEIDTTEILQKALADGKQVCVPLCDSKTIMSARKIDSLQELKIGYYGLHEPSAEAQIIDADKIDLVLVPCSVCDNEFHRIGKGGGYYDRYLANIKAEKMLLCPSGLSFKEIPQESHDILMDAIVTEVCVSYKN